MNKEIIYNIKDIISEKNIKIKKLKRSENPNEISIIYKIDNNQKIIKIFYKSFVMKNKNNCKIIFKREIFECNSLLSLPDISKLNISNVTNMRAIFYGCTSLISFSCISNWNTTNVSHMSYMFYKCISLKCLPDISKCNTSELIIISGIFLKCTSLLYLPDISKWNTTNVIDMS